MIKFGMMIGDRYEVLEKIGTGGMSDVYKAKCHKLNRFVAIKVLKQEFSENANFVQKFRAEAQAAAGLMHPNIVNVYDVGEEDGIYYIVMELIDGITLKKYIEKKARLSVKEAISIAIQVSMGIEAAHNNNIIHRDIKPQNVIISKEGKVKVTDFGIAKAATSNTITSNVMGSVHYTSPEQARGGYSDEKSDIYSLGITLFEMLTGRVPFNGETTVAIAIKHIQEEMPSPREFVSEIPISVEQIVYKCCQKSPDRRYQSIGEVIADLKKSLINPDEEFVKVVDFSSKEETKMISDNDLAQIKKQSEKRDSYEEQVRMKNVPMKQEVRKKQQTQQERSQRPLQKEYKYEEEIEEENSKMDKVTTVFIVIIAVLIGCILLFFAGRALGLFAGNKSIDGKETVQDSNKVIMVEVIGKSLDEAQKALDQIGISYKTEYDISKEYGKNTVMKATNKEGVEVVVGTELTKDTEITLLVSAGADGVKIPDVTGASEAEATAALEKEGFAVSKEQQESTSVAKGNVISQSPEAGSILQRNSSIKIVVSTGAKSSKVPNVLGMTEEAAKAAIVASGFVCTTVSEVANTEYAAGTVCYQGYQPDTEQAPGSDIEIRLSLGGTYSCNISVNAPEDYQSGSATVVLNTATDNSELFRTTVDSFPVAINLNGIKNVDTGIITIVYTVPTNEPVTDANGNTSYTKTATKEQTVTFTKE